MGGGEEEGESGEGGGKGGGDYDHLPSLQELANTHVQLVSSTLKSVIPIPIPVWSPFPFPFQSGLHSLHVVSITAFFALEKSWNGDKTGMGMLKALSP